MAVNGIGALQYRNVYNQTNSRVESNSNQPEKAAVQDKIDFSADSLAQSAALRSLQEKFPKMSFSVGTGLTGRTSRNTGDNANRWAFTLDPKLLEKMNGSPEAEAEFSQKIRDIERATAFADSFSKAMGMKTVYCDNYIDENGQLHHESVLVRKDELNEELRAQARENAEKIIERVREKNKDAADKLEEMLDKAEETGELVLGDEDMRVFGEAANVVDIQQTEEAAESDEEIESESVGKSMGINAAKLARMLAAAKTRSQVQAVMDMIQSDLRECDAGKEQGYDVDEASVSAAESLLEEAKSRMSSAEDREPTPQEEMATALASLM
ncbi:MAG: hypothetical protein IK990_06500 [Ruminiclostridium sp.]|nr:hypothetical protein [Ruminiclostridium sp.]MBP3855244.1 hypothetical protein [Ruminiclostridium sp.]